MKIDIIGSFESLNNQEILKIVEELGSKLSVPKSSLVEIIAVSDTEINELNKKHRAKDEVTDVLSFPISSHPADEENILGSIVIAENFSLKNHEKIAELIKHGFLHLMGFDHETDVVEWNEAASKVGHHRL